MKSVFLLLIPLALIFASCLSYSEEDENRFQENRIFIEAYVNEIGLTNNPFFELIPNLEKDKQRKKHVASLSREELKALIDQKASGIPRLESGTPRSEAYFKEIEGLSDLEQAYKILTEKYPDIIVK